jgi:hypothetical protein
MSLDAKPRRIGNNEPMRNIVLYFDDELEDILREYNERVSKLISNSQMGRRFDAIRTLLSDIKNEALERVNDLDRDDDDC